jgi:hypothetical protein
VIQEITPNSTIPKTPTKYPSNKSVEDPIFPFRLRLQFASPRIQGSQLPGFFSVSQSKRNGALFAWYLVHCKLELSPRSTQLLRDVWFLEKLAHFDREIIAERRI